MKVSIIIPTLNRQKFIIKAITSVLGQSYSDFELFVIDDGSTDSTEQIVRALTDPRIIYKKVRNQGVSAARNCGIAHAKGDWIAFLDSDDQWLPKKLEEQLAFHEHHPHIKISQTQERWIRHGKRVNQMKKHQKHGGMIYEKCLPLCLITPSSVMIKQEVLNTVGFFDEELPACEDYDLWLRITCAYAVGLIDKELIVKYGGHSDQLSRTIPSLDKYRIQAMQKILASQCLNKEQTTATIQELKTKCRVYGNGCLKRGKEKEGQRYLELIQSL